MTKPSMTPQQCLIQEINGLPNRSPRSQRITDIAKKLGKTERTIRKWLSGAAIPHAEQMLLAQEYGLQIPE